MKKFTQLLTLLISCAIIMISCTDDKDDSLITLSDGSEKSQNVFADEQSSGGFTFTAQSSWKINISESTPKTFSETRIPMGKAKNPQDKKNTFFGKMRSNNQTKTGSAASKSTFISDNSGPGTSNVSWINLLVNGAESYKGEAGTYTVAIVLQKNYTGKTRSAQITISCGDDTITITVTQQDKTETGVIPENPSEGKLISKISSGGDYEENGKNVGYWHDEVNFVYNSDNTISLIMSSFYEDYNGVISEDTYSAHYTYDGNNIFINYPGKADMQNNVFLDDKGKIITGDGTEIYDYTEAEMDENGNEVEKVVEYTTTLSSTTSYTGDYIQEHSERTFTKKNTSKSLRSAYYIESSKSLINFVWQNQNLIATNYSINETDSEGDTNHLGPYRSDVTYNSNLVNKANLDLNWLVFNARFPNSLENDGLPLMGYYGSRSKNLAVTESVILKDNNPHEYSFTWKIDGDGYPTSVTIERKPWTDDNGTTHDGWVEVYVIEYI